MSAKNIEPNVTLGHAQLPAAVHSGEPESSAYKGNTNLELFLLSPVAPSRNRAMPFTSEPKQAGNTSVVIIVSPTLLCRVTNSGIKGAGFKGAMHADRLEPDSQCLLSSSSILLKM